MIVYRPSGRKQFEPEVLAEIATPQGIPGSEVPYMVVSQPIQQWNQAIDNHCHCEEG